MICFSIVQPSFLWEQKHAIFMCSRPFLSPSSASLLCTLGVTHHTSHTTHHTSYITPHTSYLTPHTSHITHRTSHVTHHSSLITHHTSPIHTSHIIHHTSHLTSYTSHIIHHTSHTICHSSHITHHLSPSHALDFHVMCAANRHSEALPYVAILDPWSSQREEFKLRGEVDPARSCVGWAPDSDEHSYCI